MDKGTPLEVWGPMAWNFLHCITFNYPEKVTDKVIKDQTKQFFNSVGYVLPCKTCGDDFRDIISKNKIDSHLGSRDSLSRWFYDIHNMVNKKLGVHNNGTPTYEEVKKRYRDCGKQQRVTFPRRTLLLVFLIILIMIILFITRK
jgi:hypothetical protein